MKQPLNFPKKGFTLIELMIVIAIVAILATIAVPSYQNYTKKAAVSELLQAAAPYRAEVELCMYNTGNTENCDAGNHGISANLENSTLKHLKSISVSDGVITVTGQNTLDGVNYTLRPTLAKQGVTWQATCTSNAELFPAGFCS
ncbi:prepilin peptidase-dependent pilin [Pasteurella sp. PK-2025]|uniref:prepilin peptidase-dependent pilin n=1 Tax=unclassified Pasteurella TaxID=2621516 RepID=UPI003C77D249